MTEDERRLLLAMARVVRDEVLTINPDAGFHYSAFIEMELYLGLVEEAPHDPS